MSKNEAETRYELIDPVLRGKGYCVPYVRLETPAPVEPTGPKGRRRNGPGKIDYLLCVEVPGGPKPLPVAILEAKREGEDPLKGMQQAKGYSECERFDAKYIFSTNGHLYAKFNKFTGVQTGPFPFADFPDHPRLTDCYHRQTGIKLDDPSALLLFQPDSPAYPETRYYQDAAIRAAFEKILQSEVKDEAARILLSLATGSGKTIIAANLLWRLHEAERLPKPALFLCDRDELRGQAYTRLKAVFGDNARIVETKDGENAAKNARVHIATYQTLGLDDDDAQFASFLSEHYGGDAFSVIIIDECHRSAWGKWSEVLKRNPNAIHIGLTATPRQLRASKTATDEDVEITANNHKYFGEPVYEYTLIEAQEDGYLDNARLLRPELEQVDGFVDNVRYRSLTRQGWLLSLSGWRDEKAVVRWRTQMRHMIQDKARSEIFSDYHLRVGQVTQDTRMPQGYSLEEQRLDETEIGEATTVILVDARRPPEWVAQSKPEDVAKWLGLGLESRASGLVAWDVFDAVLSPGDVILLTSWKNNAAAAAFESGAPLQDGKRLRQIRVVRDYGMFDRREAPQYYPDGKGAPTIHP